MGSRRYFGSSRRDSVAFNENAHGKAPRRRINCEMRVRTVHPRRKTFATSNLLTTNAWSGLLGQSVKINGTKRRVASRRPAWSIHSSWWVRVRAVLTRGVATLTVISSHKRGDSKGGDLGSRCVTPDRYRFTGPKRVADEYLKPQKSTIRTSTRNSDSHVSAY